MTRTLLALLFLTGCGGHYEHLSSGAIGCRPDDITIQDIAHNGNATTWEADCGGRAYACTEIQHGSDTTACSAIAH